MEDASVAPKGDESSFEENNHSMNGQTVDLEEELYTKSLLLDIVNGHELSRISAVGKAAACDHLKLEENLNSEDFINNNKEASEQSFFTNQRHVTSGDATSIKDKLSFADNRRELFFQPSEDMENKETLNLVHESSQSSDKKKEQTGREVCREQTKQALENHTRKRNFEGNGKISPDEQEEINMETKTLQLELLEPYSVDQEESDSTQVSSSEKSIEKDCLKFNSITDQSMSASKTLVEPNKKLTLSDQALMNSDDATQWSQDLFEDGYNDFDSHIYNDTMCTANGHSGVKEHDKHLENHPCGIKTGANEFSGGHLDLLANSTEKTIKNRSLHFQSKHSGIDLPNCEGTKTSKLKRELQPLKVGRTGPHYEMDMDCHELSYFKKENLSDKEESSEDDYKDSSLHYDHPRDRHDHRKERHQYVSDQLDPDVLHLLEMHLRKQQLVDIKEEGEEELVDVHINKERSRSEPFKLLRNIPPVLDMVLEEPELENAGELLEDSKTPSEIDSDDSSNVCAMEMCLMESLQDDLMSKSSKIEKNEIATILQTASSETLPPEHKTKQKTRPWHQNDRQVHGDGIMKESDTQMKQTGDLQTVTSYSVVDGDFGSDCETMRNSHNIGVESDLFPDSRKGVNEKHIPLNDAEDHVADKIILGELDKLHECLINESVNKDSDSKGHEKSESNTACTGTTLGSSQQDGFIKPETILPNSVNLKTTSGLTGHSLDGKLKLYEIIEPYLETKTPPLMQGSQKPNDLSPTGHSDFITENDSTEQPDCDRTVRSEKISPTGLTEDLQAKVKSPRETAFPEPPAEMNTLHVNLEEKIMSILEKAHAADCRSSHLQAEAELLWKESMELRNECKSLSKEAADLLSIFTQQAAVQRPPTTKRSAHKTKAGGSLLVDTKLRTKEILSSSSNANSKCKKKGEGQLQALSQKFSFLREETPEIMQELNTLQRDLKSLHPHHSKPINIFYHLLWGGLVTGGTMLFVWWMNKQLG